MYRTLNQINECLLFIYHSNKKIKYEFKLHLIMQCNVIEARNNINDDVFDQTDE